MVLREVVSVDTGISTMSSEPTLYCEKPALIMMPLETRKKIQRKLKQNGRRLTCQRQIILNVLLDHACEHLTIEEIYQNAKQRSSKISIATVYRTVLCLEQAKILHKIRMDDNRGRYELIARDVQNGHPHLICIFCKKPIDIVDNQMMCLLETCRIIIQSRYDFVIDTQNIQYYGRCHECHG